MNIILNKMAAQATKCSNCDKFYGSKENLCSHCFCERHGLPKPQGLYINIENYWKDHNMTFFPTSVFYELLQITKNYAHINNSIIVANNIHAMMRAYQTSTKFMLSDEQAIKLIKIIPWRFMDSGYKVSHAITRWRLTPWSSEGFNEFHASSSCYYGNFNEKPISEIHLTGVYNNNLNSGPDV